MTIQLDPERSEIKALLDYASSFTGKSVLEIGCGDGRLVWRYAPQTAYVVGIDPNHEKITRAIKSLPATLQERVEFQACDLHQFEKEHSSIQRSREFDLAILAWSL